jgi:hypothetical protein
VWSVIFPGGFSCRYVNYKHNKSFHFKVSNVYSNAFHSVVFANTNGNTKNVLRVNFSLLSAIFKKRIRDKIAFFHTTQIRSSLAILFMYRMINNGKALLSLSGNSFQHFIYRISTFLYANLTLHLIAVTWRKYRENIFQVDYPAD